MRNLKIYCVGTGNGNIANWMRGNICGSIEKADVVVFPGGADINPEIYGEKANSTTNFDNNLDAKETLEFNRAMALGKKMVGICRGAQLMCAKAGGILVQNQLNSHNFHDILTFDGKIIYVSSSHHQAMYPWKMKEDQYAVLGWALNQSTFHHGANFGEELVIGKVPMNMEVEVAFFPGINALGIQAHPEWQYPSMSSSKYHHDAIDYFRGLMDRFMSGDKFKDAKNAYAPR